MLAEGRELEAQGLVEADGGELAGAVVAQPGHAHQPRPTCHRHDVTRVPGQHAGQKRLHRLKYSKRTNGWMDGWMDRLMGGSMGEWMDR